MLVWGGTDFSGPFATGGAYDPGTDTWSGLASAGAPAARSDHGAVWTGSRMLVFGGWLSGGSFADTGGQYDPGADSWSALATANAPSGRLVPLVWTGSEMLVACGRGSSGSLDTGSRYVRMHLFRKN